MPQIRHVRGVVDRLKNMSPYLKIECTNEGKLEFKVETDFGDISTHFDHLEVYENREDFVTAVVDIKKFFTFLAWDVVHPRLAKCNILNERMVNFQMSNDQNLIIQCLMPCIQEN